MFVTARGIPAERIPAPRGGGLVDWDGTYSTWVPEGVPLFLPTATADFTEEWWADATPENPSDDDPSSADCNQALPVVVAAQQAITGIDFKMDFALPGNVNGGNAIDLADAVAMMRVMSGVPLTSEVYIVADADGDGDFGPADFIYVLQVLGGLR